MPPPTDLVEAMKRTSVAPVGRARGGRELHGDFFTSFNPCLPRPSKPSQGGQPAGLPNPDVILRRLEHRAQGFQNLFPAEDLSFNQDIQQTRQTCVVGDDAVTRHLLLPGTDDRHREAQGGTESVMNQDFIPVMLD